MYKNRKLNVRAASLCVFVLAAGCDGAPQESQRIAVGDGNTMGIVALEIARWDSGGDRGFELRGLDTSDGEVGRVLLHSGAIDDLAAGSELVVSAASHEERSVTRAVDLVELTQPSEPTLVQFLEIDAVTAVLDHEANILPYWRPEVAGSEVGFVAYTCNPGNVLSTPLAKQCGFGNIVRLESTPRYTSHVNPTGALVKRKANPSFTACKAADGVSACSGTACYYGPYGYGRPIVTAPSAGYNWQIASDYYYDDVAGWSYRVQSTQVTGAPASSFSDVTGTLATGLGCPGGQSGIGDWDY